MEIRGIKYVSFFEPTGYSFFEPTGYGEAARRAILALAKTGIPITWMPMVHGRGWGLWYEPLKTPSSGDPEIERFYNRDIPCSHVIAHVVPEYYPQVLALEKDKQVTVYSAWETDRLPKHWPELFRNLKSIWLPCNWNTEVFAREGIKGTLHVIPHLPPPPDCTPIKLSVLSETDFVFYSINVWSERKGLRQTVEAYLDTFTAKDNVSLVLLTSEIDHYRSKYSFLRKLQEHFPPLTAASLNKIMRRYPNPARITLLTNKLTHSEITALHRRADCYVSLTRGEGFALGAFDAASYGKPVIITGWGGQLDFLSADSADLVEYTLCPTIDHSGPKSYSPDQNWAEPDKTHASKLMKKIVENPALAKAKGASLQSRIHDEFSEEKTTQKMLSALTD